MSTWNQNLDQNDEDKVKALLLGHSIRKVSETELELDDGTKLTIQPNGGCGGCWRGSYAITELNGCENLITDVSVDVASGDPNDSEPDLVYRIFVMAVDKRINLLTVEGSDGNGYYGTGYEIKVTPPDISQIQTTAEAVAWDIARGGK